MFDEVTCLFPVKADISSDWLFQSKDTPAQELDLYEIREDGTLWHEAYTVRFEENTSAFFGFYLHRENKRWEPVEYEGELHIYHSVGEQCYDLRFWFKAGKVCDVIEEVFER